MRSSILWSLQIAGNPWEPSLATCQIPALLPWLWMPWLLEIPSGFWKDNLQIFQFCSPPVPSWYKSSSTIVIDWFSEDSQQKAFERPREKSVLQDDHREGNKLDDENNIAGSQIWGELHSRWKQDWKMIMYRINDHPPKNTQNKQTPSEISSFWFKYVFKEISLSQGVSLHARSAATILFCRDLATATHCNKLRKAATCALSSSCQKCQNNSLAETWQFFELLYLQSPPRPHACPHTTHAHMGDIYMWVVYKCTLNRRSLLQNIVSFIGLFCKRDLYFDRSYWP